MFRKISVKLARYKIFVFLSAKYEQCYSVVKENRALWFLLCLTKIPVCQNNVQVCI